MGPDDLMIFLASSCAKNNTVFIYILEFFKGGALSIAKLIEERALLIPKSLLNLLGFHSRIWHLNI